MPIPRAACSALAACLLLPGCLYQWAGVRYNHDVIAELFTGMPESECLQGMAQGGTIWLQRELSLTSAAARAAHAADPCWSGAVEDRLWQCEASTGRCAESALVVGRHYGFAGYGSFVLFFDEHRQLVGSCLKHYN